MFVQIIWRHPLSTRPPLWVCECVCVSLTQTKEKLTALKMKCIRFKVLKKKTSINMNGFIFTGSVTISDVFKNVFNDEMSRTLNSAFSPLTETCFQSDNTKLLISRDTLLSPSDWLTYESLKHLFVVEHHHSKNIQWLLQWCGVKGVVWHFWKHAY